MREPGPAHMSNEGVRGAGPDREADPARIKIERELGASTETARRRWEANSLSEVLTAAEKIEDEVKFLVVTGSQSQSKSSERTDARSKEGNGK